MSSLTLLFLLLLCIPTILGDTVTNICVTETCKKEASAIKMDMDDSVNPCENFYQFACKNFLAEHSATTHKKLLKAFMSNVETDILRGKKQLTSYRTFGLINHFYESCFNEDQVESVGLEPVKSVLQEIGGWPVLENNKSSYSMSLREIMYKLWENDIYIDPFFTVEPDSLTVIANGRKEKKRILKIGCGKAGNDVPSLKYNYNNKTANQYLSYMKETAELFGASKERAIRDMKKAWDLEMKIIKMKCRNNENVQPTSLRDMSRLYPGFEWDEYIRKYLAPFSPVYQSMDIYVMAPDFLKEVLLLLTSMKKNNMRIMMNYIGWFIVNKYPYYLNKEMIENRKQFCQKTKCYVEKRPRQEICAALVRDNFGFADELGLAYQHLYSDQETMMSVSNMVKEIKSELESKINSMSWMDPKELKEMKEQYDRFTFGVGVPNDWNSNFVDELYQELSLNPQQFYKNVLKATSFNLRHLDRLQKNTILYGGNIKVAIKTDIFEGSYQIKTAHCQGIYFNKERPRSMNYAGLGVRLGNEVLDTYYRYLKYSDKEKPGQKKLARIVKCFRERYKNATSGVRPTELWVDLESDMLSIMGSLNLVYHSYLRNSNGDQTLAGVVNTSRQLFWLNAAREFCSGEDPEERYGLSNEQKTNLYFSTQPGFRQDWQCPESSAMSLGETCELW